VLRSKTLKLYGENYTQQNIYECMRGLAQSPGGLEVLDLSGCTKEMDIDQLLMMMEKEHEILTKLKSLYFKGDQINGYLI
jgi:hypothetical protein